MLIRFQPDKMIKIVSSVRKFGDRTSREGRENKLFGMRIKGTKALTMWRCWLNGCAIRYSATMFLLFAVSARVKLPLPVTEFGWTRCFGKECTDFEWRISDCEEFQYVVGTLKGVTM